MKILRLNKAGMPTSWMTQEEAAVLYAKEMVLWELGDKTTVLNGGINSLGQRSRMDIASIIAVEGHVGRNIGRVKLNNHMLFRRDNFRCLYCGDEFVKAKLTRDHIIPRVQGGPDIWTNVACACKRCNNIKGGRTPEEAGMSLLAVPFEPNWFEYLFLENGRILGDQMDYLSSNFSKKRPWKEHLIAA